MVLPLADGTQTPQRTTPVKHSGVGFVTRFEVDAEFLTRYPVQQAGGRTILELWVSAEELDEFNAHIVGEIQLVHTFR